MMTGWLVVNGFLKSGKFDELARMFCDAAESLSVSDKKKFRLSRHSGRGSPADELASGHGKL